MLNEFCNQEITILFHTVELKWQGKNLDYSWVVEETEGEEMEKSVETSVFDKICFWEEAAGNCMGMNAQGRRFEVFQEEEAQSKC